MCLHLPPRPLPPRVSKGGGDADDEDVGPQPRVSSPAEMYAATVLLADLAQPEWPPPGAAKRGYAAPSRRPARAALAHSLEAVKPQVCKEQ